MPQAPSDSDGAMGVQQDQADAGDAEPSTSGPGHVADGPGFSPAVTR